MADKNYAHPMAGTRLATAKTEFEVRMLAALGSERASLLSNGRLQLVEAAYYAAKALGSVTQMELMEDKDTWNVGITNVNNRKLTTGENMLIAGVQILEAQISGTDSITDAVVASATYGKISSAVANGEFELKVGETCIVPRVSMEIFRRSADANHLEGYHALDCPKMIADQTAIKPSVWFPAAINSGRSCLKVVLHGVKTIKA